MGEDETFSTVVLCLFDALDWRCLLTSYCTKGLGEFCLLLVNCDAVELKSEQLVLAEKWSPLIICEYGQKEYALSPTSAN